MRTDKEIDRKINQYLLSNEEMAWLKEEMYLEQKLDQSNKSKINKLKRKIRGLKKQKQILKDFEKELDKEFESIYG